ncbi:hypothetical protein DFQ27_005269 [Actinomortierella ambigua]|uniref:Uncharacterized protein n=1 Tax=Actinomortierella ambigua TaxID=1343610 RepID=A0A9P6Q2G8_9FUNG|nr:hypothetical protein DFQ26_008194 [Actinomortierella ambigua]KAG0257190.1 hypothetical protein DFQ27_005269 [Actinomortierella ambigua]
MRSFTLVAFVVVASMMSSVMAAPEELEKRSCRSDCTAARERAIDSCRKYSRPPSCYQAAKNNYNLCIRDC